MKILFRKNFMLHLSFQKKYFKTLNHLKWKKMAGKFEKLWQTLFEEEEGGSEMKERGVNSIRSI